MDMLAPISRYVIAPLWAAWERSPYLRIARRLRRTQYVPPDVIERRQWAKLKQLLAHAYSTTPFWRERLDADMARPRSQ